MSQQYRYIYEDSKEKCIVTSVSQLSGKAGISARRLRYAFKSSDIYQDKYGRFKVERVPYYRDSSKVRIK